MSMNVVCPACHGRLEVFVSDSRCAQCDVVYPSLPGNIPVLATDGPSLVHQAFVGLHRLKAAANRRIKELQAAIQRVDPRRAGSISRLCDATDANSRYLDALMEWLRPALSVDGAVEALLHIPAPGTTDAASHYLDAHRYLRRDWSRAPECEAEIGAIRQRVHSALTSFVGDSGPVVVLGAGAGRLAHDLAGHLDQVVAVDRSVVMAGSFYLLGEKIFRLYEINEKNVAVANDKVRPFDVGGISRDAVLSVQYLVADALKLPLPDRSVSAVISVWFTDVVPPSRLLAEVSRILTPGGLFYHLGPLSYHFSDPGERFAADELRQFIVEMGFTIAAEGWTSSTWMTSTASLAAMHIRSWHLAAILSEARNLST
jgi:carnosine N-methyltransferase